jgi:hypothetical protein
MGCPLMLYPDLRRIWQTESKSDIIEIMDSFAWRKFHIAEPGYSVKMYVYNIRL